MTRDDIIRMAREAGFVVGVSEERWGDVPYAKLCHPTPNQTGLYSMLENLIRKATAAEREACLKIMRETPFSNWYASDVDYAIRARGES